MVKEIPSHILPKVQSKMDISTDTYLKEGLTDFSGTLRSEIDPAINFDIVKCIVKTIYT